VLTWPAQQSIDGPRGQGTVSPNNELVAVGGDKLHVHGVGALTPPIHLLLISLIPLLVRHDGRWLAAALPYLQQHASQNIISQLVSKPSHLSVMVTTNTLKSNSMRNINIPGRAYIFYIFNTFNSTF